MTVIRIYQGDQKKKKVIRTAYSDNTYICIYVYTNANNPQTLQKLNRIIYVATFKKELKSKWTWYDNSEQSHWATECQNKVKQQKNSVCNTLC